MHRLAYLCAFSRLIAVCNLHVLGQAAPSEKVQVGPPVRRIDPPSPTATAEELEMRGDQLRAEKAYLDSLDYFRAALVKNPKSAQIYNKMGIVQLQTYHLNDAKKCFERAIKLNKDHADAYNNLGVVHYEMKKYGKAIKLYSKAISIEENGASYFSNLGAAYFSRKTLRKPLWPTRGRSSSIPKSSNV